MPGAAVADGSDAGSVLAAILLTTSSLSCRLLAQCACSLACFAFRESTALLPLLTGFGTKAGLKSVLLGGYWLAEGEGPYTPLKAGLPMGPVPGK